MNLIERTNDRIINSKVLNEEILICSISCCLSSDTMRVWLFRISGMSCELLSSGPEARKIVCVSAEEQAEQHDMVEWVLAI